eukprot:6190638-Pleurochrysis_carterae.AAC.1
MSSTTSDVSSEGKDASLRELRSTSFGQIFALRKLTKLSNFRPAQLAVVSVHLCCSSQYSARRQLSIFMYIASDCEPRACITGTIYWHSSESERTLASRQNNNKLATV